MNELPEDRDLVHSGRPTKGTVPPGVTEMIPRIAEAHYVRDHTVHLRFTDGTEGDVDLQGELYGEVFEPLRDRAFFQQFFVHPEFHTLAWPNGADIAQSFCTRKSNLQRNERLAKSERGERMRLAREKNVLLGRYCAKIML